MGRDTYIKLRGHLEPEQILNVVKYTIDRKAKIDILTTTKYSWATVTTCYICFTYKNEKFSAFYYYDGQKQDFPDEIEQDPRLKEMSEVELTSISMHCCKESIEVGKMLCTHLGGWIDEDDCDDKTYYEIKKGTVEPVKPIRTVTMEEIYEKFGEVVKIVDRK